MDSEKWLEKQFIREADHIGGLSLKFVSPGYKGPPDRILLIKGLVFFAEIKTTGKKPTPRQLFVHEQFFKHGFHVWVIDCREQLTRFFDFVKKYTELL